MTANTSTQAGLLRAIIENPSDDFVRLVLADWCEENGDGARAEFIRVQCELATSSIFCDGDCYEKGCLYCRWCDLRRREQELLEEHWWEWVRPLRPEWEGVLIEAGPEPDRCEVVFGPNAWRGIFRRGFVAEIHCRTAEWVGEECVVCDGQGKHRFPYGYITDPCGTCHGTGRIGGHGPRLVLAAPIEMVIITDPHPDMLDRHEIGPDAFELLHQPNEQAWNTEVSRRLITWARQEAGLPRLPRHRDTADRSSAPH